MNTGYPVFNENGKTNQIHGYDKNWGKWLITEKYSNKYALLVFVKNAELGRVKTRLAQFIGDTNALTVYRALIEKTREIIELINAQKVIYYSDYIDEYDQFPEKIKTCWEDLESE